MQREEPRKIPNTNMLVQGATKNVVSNILVHRAHRKERSAVPYARPRQGLPMTRSISGAVPHQLFVPDIPLTRSRSQPEGEDLTSTAEDSVLAGDSSVSRFDSAEGRKDTSTVLSDSMGTLSFVQEATPATKQARRPSLCTHSPCLEVRIHTLRCGPVA